MLPTPCPALRLAPAPALRHRGFTLVELMIVVAVIGILAGIGIPAYQSYMREARRADAQLRRALDLVHQLAERARHLVYDTRGIWLDQPRAVATAAEPLRKAG